MPMYAIEYYNQATSLRCVPKHSDKSNARINTLTSARPYDCRMWTALATVYESLQRLPESIECQSRALLGADRTQTTAILHKLASLHTSIAESQAVGSANLGLSAEATDYHRKIIALGQDEGLGVAELAASYLAVAEWEMTAKHFANGESKKEGSGDLTLASLYLGKVASTNAPQRDRAEALLRDLRMKEARLAASS